MTRKQPAARATQRVLASLVIGGLVTTLVVVYIDRRSSGESVATPPLPSSTTTTGPPSALQGDFDVAMTVASVEYGATWSAATPRLTPGQVVDEQWAVNCNAAGCVVTVTRGHIAEDPDRAAMSSADGRTFSVSGSAPATPDSASLPPGCGAVNAIDIQRLVLTAAGPTFVGQYTVHHPTTHVEGPVAGGTASCDSFNVVFDISGRRR